MPSLMAARWVAQNSPSNMWQSLVTIGQATSEIRRRKKERKKDLNYSGKTEWPAGGRP